MPLLPFVNVFFLFKVFRPFYTCLFISLLFCNIEFWIRVIVSRSCCFCVLDNLFWRILSKSTLVSNLIIFSGPLECVTPLLPLNILMIKPKLSSCFVASSSSWSKSNLMALENCDRIPDLADWEFFIVYAGTSIGVEGSSSSCARSLFFRISSADN